MQMSETVCVLETGPIAVLKHQQASPRGISKPIKHVNQMLCNISVEVRRGKARQNTGTQQGPYKAANVMPGLSQIK